VSPTDKLKAMMAITQIQLLLTDYQCFYVDWAKLNSDSPDHDPAYRPEFPPRQKDYAEAVTTLTKLIREAQ
jgi:hypothetical protein